MLKIYVIGEIIHALGHMLAVWAVVAQLLVDAPDVAKHAFSGDHLSALGALLLLAFVRRLEVYAQSVGCDTDKGALVAQPPGLGPAMLCHPVVKYPQSLVRGKAAEDTRAHGFLNSSFPLENK